jgi:DNA invertase Pin-like site-specific DNA recombinase
MNTIKAYAYVRVSGQGQINGDGFQRQSETIEAYAKSHGFEIVQTYQEEGISGTKDVDARPTFQSMVSAILKNGVRIIIIEGLDRLAREYRIQETLLVYLASKGITLISARTEENVTEAIMADPMKKALIQIQGVFAELEKNLLVKKLRTAREHKKNVEGKCEGRKSTAEVDPDVIKRIKALRRKRPNTKPMSYSKIAETLNAEGSRTITGCLWTMANVRQVHQRNG